MAHFGVAALFALLTLIAQRSLVPVATHRVYDQLVYGNDSLLHVWALAWGQHALATDPLHVFDANIFHPYPATLLYSDHLLGLAILLAPLRLFTDNVVFVHNVAVLAAPALCGLAMFALIFDLTRSYGAGVVAGLIYGFAPIRFDADRSQIQMLAAWWLPLLLLWGRRTIAHGRTRTAVACGLALAFQGLMGIYLTAFFAPFLAVAHVYWLRRYPFTTYRGGWTRLIFAEVAACVILLPTAIAYRQVQSSLGAERSIVLNALLSIRPDMLAGFIPVWTLGALFVLAVVTWRRAPRAYRAEAPLFAVIMIGGLVLALGPAITLPAELGSIRGPYAALMNLPGFSALRTPGRMLHVALLGAAAIAGGGVAAATARLTPAVATVAAGIVTALITMECATERFSTVPVPPPPGIDPTYAWLKTQSRDMRLVELPMRQAAVAEQVVQYASTWHWKPMLNGNMGILPPAYPHMRRTLAAFPDAATLSELAALGITHVLLHDRGLPPRLRKRVTQATQGPQPLLTREFQSPGSTVYAIRADLEPATLAPAGYPLPRDRWRVTASEDTDNAHLAIDADPGSAWRSWGMIERVLTAHWYEPEAFATQWDAFIARQPTQLAVDLGEAHEIVAIVARLVGSDPMTPPAIRVDASEDGETWTGLPDGLVPIPNVRALVDDPTTARHALLLPKPIRARHVRLVCQGLELHLSDLTIHAAFAIGEGTWESAPLESPRS